MILPLQLMVIHFVADFVLQNDWMALNKSKSWLALLAHTSVYSVCFLPFYGAGFALVTFCLHTLTDAITSRLTSKLWFLPISPYYDTIKEEQCYQAFPEMNKRHWFFVMIGLDQLIHYLCLYWTLLWTLHLLSL